MGKELKVKSIDTNSQSLDAISIIENAGKQLGFRTKREYAVKGGRIDLVWYIEMPMIIPQTDLREIPIVGFEIETSWRTRKHIKGDILNFQVLKPYIGV